MRRLAVLGVAGLLAVAIASPLQAQSTPDDQAQSTPEYLAWAQPGPYLAPSFTDFQTVPSFGSSQPIVGTYFFYWFDAAYLRTRQLAFDPYPYHPVDEATQSFYDPNWYVKQFSDMLDAGIDFILPDYWGEPGQYNRRVAPAP